MLLIPCPWQLPGTCCSSNMATPVQGEGRGSSRCIISNNCRKNKLQNTQQIVKTTCLVRHFYCHTGSPHVDAPCRASHHFQRDPGPWHRLGVMPGTCTPCLGCQLPKMPPGLAARAVMLFIASKIPGFQEVSEIGGKIKKKTKRDKSHTHFKKGEIQQLPPDLKCLVPSHGAAAASTGPLPQSTQPTHQLCGFSFKIRGLSTRK